MQEDASKKSILLSIASICIILFALKLASAFCIPVLFSFFIALLIYPVTDWLLEHRIPKFLAILLSVLFVFAFLTGIVFLGVFLVKEFAISWNDKYQIIFQERILLFLEYINSFLKNFGLQQEQGADLITYFLSHLPSYFKDFDISYLWNFGAGIASGVLGIFVFFALVFMVTVFIVFELLAYRNTFSKEESSKGVIKSDKSLFFTSLNQVRNFLVIKTLVSLLTGLFVGIICKFLNVDFYILWGLLAYLLNYIPFFGSLIAILFPACFTLLIDDFSTAFAVLIWTFVANFIIANFIEPLVLGNRLGISKLAVVLFALFWGWLWGAFGMFFSVPFLIFLQILSNQKQQLQWLASVLKGPQKL